MASLSSGRGTPNRITPGTPRAARRLTSTASESTVCWTTPGSDATGRGSSRPSATNSGATRSSTVSRVSATSRRRAGRPAQAAQAGGRKPGRLLAVTSAGRGSTRHCSPAYGSRRRGRVPVGSAGSRGRALCRPPQGPSAPTRAATSPSMVWGSASAATASPAARAEHEVTGPMETTTGGTPLGAEQLDRPLHRRRRGEGHGVGPRRPRPPRRGRGHRPPCGRRRLRRPASPWPGARAASPPRTVSARGNRTVPDGSRRPDRGTGRWDRAGAGRPRPAPRPPTRSGPGRRATGLGQGAGGAGAHRRPPDAGGHGAAAERGEETGRPRWTR